MAVAAGGYHSLALMSDGTVWAWGSNYYGQLGHATTTQRTVPARMNGFGGAVAVAAGGYHSLAAKADGSVWTWGYNSCGQLGDGTVTIFCLLLLVLSSQRTPVITVSPFSPVLSFSSSQQYLANLVGGIALLLSNAHIVFILPLFFPLFHVLYLLKTTTG
jgi:hypothetical protein